MIEYHVPPLAAVTHNAPPKSTPQRKPRFSVRVRRTDSPDSPTIEVVGRPGWLLERLIAHGSEGLTTAQLQPGLRVSHFVWLLRRDYGFEIQTENERHAGVFAGRHGKYKLITPLRVVTDEVSP